jgi:hypothetical protein
MKCEPLSAPDRLPINAVDLKFRDPAVNDVEKNRDRYSIVVNSHTLDRNTEYRWSARGVGAR